MSCGCSRYGASLQLCARRPALLRVVARAKSRKRERTSACLICSRVRARHAVTHLGNHARRGPLSAATPDPRPVPRPALLSLDDAVQHRGGSPIPSGFCIMKCTTGAMRQSDGSARLWRCAVRARSAAAARGTARVHGQRRRSRAQHAQRTRCVRLWSYVRTYVTYVRGPICALPFLMFYL